MMGKLCGYKHVIYDDFRRSPIYEQALLTPDTLGRTPPYRYHARNTWDDIKICEAGLRLDHLIRNALRLPFFREFPNVEILSAIKLFVEQIESRMQIIRVLDKTQSFIEPRLRFCRNLLARSDEDLRNAGYPPISSNDFRQFIMTTGNGVEEIVFHNPF